MQATLSELESAGDLLAQSGFMGIKSKAGGFVVMLTCQQENISLLQFQQRYHYQQGRFSMQAHHLLSEFKVRGGRDTLIERSPERAALELEKDGNKYLSEVTWAEAQKDTFVYEGGEKDILALLTTGQADKLKIKPKYQTPRSRQQMLWARAISDGVVAVDPGCRSAYTDEEVEDIIESDTGSARSTPEPATATPAANAVRTLQAAMAGTEDPAPVTTPESVKTKAEPTTTGLVAAAKEIRKAQESADNDPAICPVGPRGHENLRGMPWEKMDTKFLSSALNAAQKGKMPEITKAHQNAIQQILNGRVDYAQKG